jgi:queuosine precursor transporter
LLKIAANGRWLWLRTIPSTVIGEGLDSLVFMTIAFAGTIPPDALVSATIMQWLFKTGYEILATPLTYVVVNFLKKHEGLDTYDRDTNFGSCRLRGEALLNSSDLVKLV